MRFRDFESSAYYGIPNEFSHKQIVWMRRLFWRAAKLFSSIIIGINSYGDLVICELMGGHILCSILRSKGNNLKSSDLF